MNPSSVAEAIWLDRIKTPAALRRSYDFSAEDAKKIIQEALRLDVWTNPYGEGPKTNKVAKLTGFVTRIESKPSRSPARRAVSPETVAQKMRATLTEQQFKAWDARATLAHRYMINPTDANWNALQNARRIAAALGVP